MGKIKKILVAIDNSQCSIIAAKEGIELARQLNAEIGIVFVVDITKAIGNPDVGIITQEALMMLKKEVEDTFNFLTSLYEKDKITKFMPEGYPAEEIINTSLFFNADLIVIGTHGRTGLKHFLLGSVAENVLRRSKVPVLSVPVKKK